MVIALYPSKRPPASAATWRMGLHFEEHETWRGKCPEISVYNDAGNGQTYFPNYFKVVALGKTKYFFGELAYHKVNWYLSSLGADSTL
jgi:hypothetical protein